MRNLFAEIKAISIPEKKPMVLKQMSTIIQDVKFGIGGCIFSRGTERGSAIGLFEYTKLGLFPFLFFLSD